MKVKINVTQLLNDLSKKTTGSGRGAKLVESALHRLGGTNHHQLLLVRRKHISIWRLASRSILWCPRLCGSAAAREVSISLFWNLSHFHRRRKQYWLSATLAAGQMYTHKLPPVSINRLIFHLSEPGMQWGWMWSRRRLPCLRLRSRVAQSAEFLSWASLDLEAPVAASGSPANVFLAALLPRRAVWSTINYWMYAFLLSRSRMSQFVKLTKKIPLKPQIKKISKLQNAN